MDLKKVFDQTVREIKREVNKKVLKVPEMEQKVLEATSNEPWGPHGSIMADLAQATRNHNDYQMIMGVLWKRLNDSGKNWRHVYKALTVLEFLVGHGAERVIDELREHAYQLQTLVDFQYVEANGKDQGLNVRRKAQSLVGLINDTEKIREVRQKAAANRDKYRGISSTGGIYKSSSYSSSGGNFGGDREDDRYGGSGKYGNRDDDRYGGSRGRDYDSYRDDERYSRDGDRYGKDNDRYRDNDLGHDRDRDDDRYGSRPHDRYSDKDESNVKDRDRDRSFEDDDKYSTKSGGKADEYSHDERRSERTNERTKGSAPPSYEDISTNSPPYSSQDDPSGSGLANAVAKATKVASQLRAPTLIMRPASLKIFAEVLAMPTKSTQESDDFDPRGSSVAPAPIPPAVPVISAVPSSATIEQDLFGEMAPKPIPPSALSKYGSSIEDLFGEATFQSSSVAVPQYVTKSETTENLFESSAFNASVSGPSNFTTQSEDLLPPSAASTTDFSSFTTAPIQNYTATPVSFNTFPLPSVNNPPAATSNFNTLSTAPLNSTTQSAAEFFGDSPFSAFGGPTTAQSDNKSIHAPVPASQTIAPVAASQTSNGMGMAKLPEAKNKFEPKSSVWADHLSSGLLDINIAKPKNNPLAELGIHLDSSLTERRREVTSAPAVKGKAMGSGSGLGIVGASILTPPTAPPVMGGGMGGMGMAPGMSMGMGYGMNPGFGMAPRMGMNPGLGLGAGMGMNPAMMQKAGPGPGPATGMGMNPTFGMGTGTGGYPYPQNYGGFR